VFVCVTPTDTRESFDGLSAVVRDHLKQDPLAGDLFIFRKRRGARLKLLYWDCDGLAV
jgi:transposase